MDGEMQSIVNVDRLQAFDAMFIAAHKISGGERTLVGFLLASDGMHTRQQIADAFDVSFKTAFRWLQMAMENGTLVVSNNDMLNRGCVCVARLSELASGDG